MSIDQIIKEVPSYLNPDELTREEFNILTDIYQQHLFDRIKELRRMDRRWEGLQTINDLKEVNDHYKTVRVPLLDKLHRLSAKAP